MAAPVDDPWVRFHELKDEESRNRLVVQYAPLVKYVVGRLGFRQEARHPAIFGS